ncbi:MAG: hypothetical protein QOJ35_656 [Solirubrobacteraceae bacterium]|nr:hypothetical protein [Solirubrobacteraceae bacterium]
MIRRAALATLCVAVTTMAGCESSQTRSARLRAAAAKIAPERGLRIAHVSPNVSVTATTVLTDAAAKRSVAVITLRNTSHRPLTALALLFTLTDAAGRKVFTNNSAGASTDLVSVPSLAPGATLAWVDDAIVNVTGARRVEARVGASTGAPRAAGAPAPSLRISGVRLERDPGGGVTAVGRIVNGSAIAQDRLVVFATARRAGRIVAAGRAVVPLLKPGHKGARFTVFFVGDPSGARLRLQAPPVRFASRG